MRNSKAAIEEFMKQKNIAVVGASRNKDKFGTAIYRELKTHGHKVYAVNPNADMVEGDRCYAGLGALPAKVDGVILCIPPAQTIAVIEEAARLGIKYIWLQQGANSPAGEAKAKELGLNLVAGECIFMFLDPVESIHKFHRFFNKLFGAYPK
jgi:predicted CoA-binding protein